MKPSQLQRHWENSLFRYILVGCVLFIVDLGVFLLLTKAGFRIGLAQIISRSVGAILGFLGHKFFSFRNQGQSHQQRTHLQFMQHMGLTIFNLFASAIIVEFGIEILNGRHVLGKVITECVMVSFTYLFSRYIFRPDRRTD